MNKIDRDFEKVLMSIKSCKNLNQLKSCQNLLDLYKIKFENDNDVFDFDDTYDFLKSQLNLKMNSLFVD
jgi:hypothetical protein